LDAILIGDRGFLAFVRTIGICNLCVVSTGVVQAVLELAGVLTDLWCLQTVYLHDTHDVGALSDPEALHTLDRSTVFRHVDREV
jgi:hypothetical protein